MSDTRAWPAFTLLPGSRRTVRFAKPGLYRYRVDGRLRGSILVVTANGGGNRPGGGEASGKETWRGTIVSDDTNAGTGQTCSATWRGTLAFTVTRGTLNGSGEASLSGTPSCSVKLPTPELQRVTFTVTGTEQAGAAATTLRLLMHPRTVRPSGLVYDAGGFLLHFGKRGEGVPFVLPVHGRKVAASVKRTVGNVTLDDRFVLTRSG